MNVIKVHFNNKSLSCGRVNIFKIHFIDLCKSLDTYQGRRSTVFCFFIPHLKQKKGAKPSALPPRLGKNNIQTILLLLFF